MGFRIQRIGNEPGTDQEVLARAKYAALDLELTGLRVKKDKILEIGIVFCDEKGKPIATFETLINPRRDTGNIDIHQISDEMVQGAPVFPDIVPFLADILDGKIIVGNNSFKDFYMLKDELMEVGTQFRPGKSIDLKDFLNDDKFTDRYFDLLKELLIDQECEHRALPDAKVVAKILPAVLEFIKGSLARQHQFYPCTFPVRNIIRSL